MSLGQSMNITLGSMRNNQYALTVVSQNIANAFVPGYHRQRVNFQTNEYTTDCRNVIETIRGMNGASIASLSNYIDDGTFKSMIDANSDAQYYNKLADNLGALEDLADNLGDNGLNALLNDFYSAAADLEKHPTDLTVRRQFAYAAQNICDKFNQLSSKCDEIQQDKAGDIQTQTDVINGLLESLASANQEYVKNGQNPQLKAEINSILEELSNYMDVETQTNPNGSVNLYIAGVPVVQGGEQKYSLNATFDPNNPDNALQFSLQSLENPDYVITDGVNESFKSGALKADIEFLNGKGKDFSNINDFKGAINSAAKAFAKALNEIQTYSNGNVVAASIKAGDEGKMELQESTVKFLVSSSGNDDEIDASNISVNQQILDDPYLIAAARIDKSQYKDADGNLTDDWKKAVGNSDNAVEFGLLKDAKICTYDNGVACTLSQFLTDTAAKNGIDVANAQNKADVANSLAANDAANYANLIGVNLDEELADMLKYQRAYEASCRMFSTIDSLISTIINMV